MAESITLAPEVRKMLRRILSDLTLSQASLAAKAGVSQGFISNLITGRMPVRDGALAVAVAEALADELKFAVQAGIIDRETGKTYQETASAVRNAFGRPKRPVLTFPGDIVSNTSSDYIDRRVSVNELTMTISAAVASLLEDMPVTTTIAAPADSGKGTFVKALRDELAAAGAQVVTLDIATLVDPQEESTGEALKTKVLSHIARQARNAWSLPDTIPSDSKFFLDWLAAQSEPEHGSPRALILENVEGSGGIAAAILPLIRKLHNERSLNSTLPSLFVSCAFDSPDVQYLFESATMFVRHVDMHWFDKDEVEALAMRLGVNQYSEIYEYFCGQPLLTHTALVQLSEVGRDLDEIFQQARLGRGQFLKHEGRLLPLIKRMLDQGIDTLIGSAVSEESLHFPEVLFLSSQNILDIRGGVLRYSSPYYETVIPRLLHDLGTGSHASAAVIEE